MLEERILLNVTLLCLTTRHARSRQRITLEHQGDPSDTILTIKQKIQAISKVETGDQRLLITDEKIVCDENKTVKECKLEDGAIVALVFKKAQDPPEWEEVDIHLLPKAGEDGPAGPAGPADDTG
eukprot:CAMPEP_0196724542 /NCGR_PEP_ID=MMETSP1091-20130531/6347_1 /TAXON_ID=302021 /ORGANISM="Rhodomonas sp., Strain CCMP768" /LENGTH=124 /DNA_ID=CAMNT_0042066673 /DNA_START=57 /DNA_END=432 /DNA_ORIENTATION=+